jgi:ABC-type multidrug transport system fused ATPase/permease subunit
MIAHVKRTLGSLNGSQRAILYLFSSIRVLLGVVDILGILLVGALISALNNAGSQSTSENTSNSLAQFVSFNEFTPVQIAVVALLVFLFKSIISSIFAARMSRYFIELETIVIRKSYVTFMKSNIEDISSWSKQRLANGLTYSSGYALTSTLTSTITIISEASLLIAITVAFAFVNLALTIGMIVFFIIIGVFLQTILGRKFQDLGKLYSDSVIAATREVEDVIDSFREIRTTSREYFFIDKFMDQRKNQAKASATIGFLSALPRFVVESALLIGAALLVVGSVYSDSQISAPVTIGIFLTGGFRIMASMLPLQTALGTLRQYSEQSWPFFDFQRDFTSPGLSTKPPTNLSLSHQDELSIKLQNIGYTYRGNEKPALLDISIDIEPGQQVAIIGPSGSGKSTLADLLMQLTIPTNGKILFNGVDSQSIDFSDGYLSYVPQKPGLVNGTIAENIALGLPSQRIDFSRLLSSIKDAGLSDVVDSLPLGVNTHLGPKSDSLSGGQIQRIGLARAFYNSPRFLILDEATSALDSETESLISNSLEILRGKCTTIIIAHNLATVKNADVVHILSEGQVVASGSFSELAKKDTLLARYIELSDVNTTD